MAMKTFDELKTAGTLAELSAAVTANTKRVDELFKKGDSMTADELTEIERLDTETEALQARAVELKKVDDIKSRNTARMALVGQVSRPPFAGGTTEPGTEPAEFKAMEL